MNASPPFDLQTAHRHFAAEAFNTAWDLIDSKDRTAEQELEMLARAFASLWHWKHRDDLTNQSRSVGYWQISRAFALLSEGSMAMRCGQLALKYARGTLPFYEAYAYEALARAAVISGDSAAAKKYLAAARTLVERVEEASSREMLLADLQSIHG
ncbi:hypothetical protein ACYFX5_22400 [Bremerella sp. T1]|uniref:hypothetical protein n=1 Tax=Bremerella sp. TYQ1 TaxID=3119568 RepID=UPI001CCD1DBA|nr:hypothetical protein [Bremerella volcania]UBM35790.1 hypothetical protein LA756_24340 [Bremerella volcania]